MGIAAFSSSMWGLLVQSPLYCVWAKSAIKEKLKILTILVNQFEDSLTDPNKVYYKTVMVSSKTW